MYLALTGKPALVIIIIGMHGACLRPQLGCEIKPGMHIALAGKPVIIFITAGVQPSAR